MVALKFVLCVFLITALLFGCAPTATNAPTVMADNQISGVQKPPAQISNITVNTLSEKTSSAVSENTSSAVKEFHVEAFQHGYQPNEIKVKQGDRVKIVLSTRDVGHSLNIAEYEINIPAQPGTSGEKEFVADKKGTFTWRCRIPCGSGHSTMSGTFIVE